MASIPLSNEALSVYHFYGENSSQWQRLEFARTTGDIASYQAEINNALSGIQQIQINRTINGLEAGYAYKEPMQIVVSAGDTIAGNANSNYQQSQYGSGSGNALIPGNFKWDADKGQYYIEAGATDSNGLTIASVLDRVKLATTGINLGAKLGMKIDEALYNANPEWWDEHLPGINPQMWTTLAGENKDGQKFIQTLFGIKDTGMTAYVDENVLAYYYQLFRDMGVWNSGEASIATYDGSTATFAIPSLAIGFNVYNNVFRITSTYIYEYSISDGYIVPVIDNDNRISLVALSQATNPKYTWKETNVSTGVISEYQININSSQTTYNSNPFKYTTSGLPQITTPTATNYFEPDLSTSANIGNLSIPYRDIGTVIFDGTVETSGGGVEGINDIDGATQYPPTNITGQTPAEILPQLKQQYPDLFTDPLQIGRMNPDYDPQDPSDPDYDPDLSRNKPIIIDNYVPIPWPWNPQPDPDTGTDIIPRPISDPEPEPVTQPAPQGKPESDLQTQTDISVEAQPDVITDPNPLNDPEIQPQPNPNPVNPDEPSDPGTPTPPDTGTGTGPDVIVPTGNASSLWAVYNPTQSQLNDFGAWLWSSSFVEQLKKLFNDPMQAIIGIHKVYATPPTGNNATIVCGYLDSQVPSKTVSSQYTEIDCGTVSIREFFGNVFDYDPYTKISCYLPFIGVVPLKTSEVMRSSVNIKYGVDVITGACIAMINIERDACGGILYTFGGSCACHYPISSGSYSGIISGLLTAAVGVATSALTSNPLPAIGGAVSAIKSSHTTVQHSGGFSGASGAMGPKKPYIIIERPQVKMAGSYPHMVGIPANATEKVGNCTGLIKCKEVHLKVSGAYSAELDEIESLLKQGVLITD